ncbi:MAG: hypothetical protein GY862_16240, partial [Gammaproteobacteria bacterium]|nr:hypothetical protein [Gammaproteobacteria bacterium]
SNNFDELKSLHATLDAAKIKLPPIPAGPDKVSLIKNSKDEAEIKKWVRERRDNRYSAFRRAVINGCEIIKAHMTDDNIQFLEFVKREKQVPARVVTKQDMEDYLSTLQKLLPLRPPGEDEKKHLYKIFVRALSHEWEDSFQPNTLKNNNKVIAAIQVTRTCARIIKAVRNWTAHTQLLDNLSECEAAFFFMAAMRAMFQLPDGKGLHGYEKTLCGLFKEPLSAGEMKALIDSGTELKKNLTDAYANLLAAYSSVLNAKGKFEPPKAENIYFTSMLTDMQNTGKINKAHETDFDCVTGLFQMFWHGLSPMMVTKFTPVHDAAGKKLRFEYTYDLKLDSYGKDAPDDFLFFLARGIYKRSFRPPA